MTVKELKEKCRKKGLKVSGTKKELQERLKSPQSTDLVNVTSEMVRVSLTWGDPRAKLVSQLIEKKFAKFICYATDNFIYEIKKEKWAEILNKE
jgi:hypothetical protein